jgi:hypothetical protein
MSVQNLAYCCGMSEIGSFPYNKTVKESRIWLKDILTRSSTTGNIATTSCENNASIVKALKLEKWRKVAWFTNSNSGNKVTVWYKRKQIYISNYNSGW